jgi:predicted porin
MMRTLATLGLTASAVILTLPAAAEDRLDMEVYGTLMPYFENVGTSGATSPVGFTTGTSLLSAGAHTGIDHERRFRMTSGTSNLGFRGDLAISGELLKLIWQIESPVPIDGEGPNNWAARNSHVGFTGSWGTLVYGNWDTPMRWVTVTSVNPIKGGYTGDMTAIIGTPGHSFPAWNSDQMFSAVFETPTNPVGFFRHEANSVQYWSPTIAGFSLRVMFSANEHRIAGVPGTEQPLNPYLLSGYLGFDWEWLRLRYAYEVHMDMFGTSIFGVGPNLDRTSSTDEGHLGLAAVRLNRDTPYETRIVVTGDHLSYDTSVAPGIPGIMNEFSRTAVYGLAQQTVGPHNIWLAYGQAFEGKCSITGGIECTTKGLGAKYPAAGYMYKFAESTGIYLLGYYLINDVSARYSPFPLLDSRDNSLPGLPNITEIAAGSDSLGVGLGFVHAFSAKIWGKDEAQKPAKVEEPPRPTTTAPLESEKANEPAPAKEGAEDEEETEEAPPAP